MVGGTTTSCSARAEPGEVSADECRARNLPSLGGRVGGIEITRPGGHLFEAGRPDRVAPWATIWIPGGNGRSHSTGGRVRGGAVRGHGWRGDRSTAFRPSREPGTSVVPACVARTRGFDVFRFDDDRSWRLSMRRSPGASRRGASPDGERRHGEHASPCQWPRERNVVPSGVGEKQAEFQWRPRAGSLSWRVARALVSPAAQPSGAARGRERNERGSAFEHRDLVHAHGRDRTVVRVRRRLLDLVHDVHAFDDLAEDGVLRRTRA